MPSARTARHEASKPELGAGLAVQPLAFTLMHPGAMQQIKRVSRYCYALFFISAGANHFVNAPFYMSIMPPYLPWHEPLVYLSGLAEIGCGVLLLWERWSRVAAWGLIVLLVAVFPANLHMARHPEHYPWASPFGLWLRLPLQGLLILWAYWYTRPPRVLCATPRVDP